jgi:hypothetical protein
MSSPIILIPKSRYDAMDEAIRAARAMVDPRTSLIMCHAERETDFEDGNGCECFACMTAQELVDALAKVPE